MNNRQIQAMETKQLIIDTAAKLMAESGFHEWKVEDLTNACGVAKGTFYHYFKSKEDVVAVIAMLPFDELKEELKKKTGTLLPELLRFYIAEFARLIERFGLGLTKQWLKSASAPQTESEKKSKLEFDMGCIRMILTDAIKKGELSEQIPVETLTIQITAQIYGMLMLWCLSDGKISMSANLKQYSDYLITAVLRPYFSQSK